MKASLGQWLKQVVPPAVYVRAVVWHDYLRGEPELRYLRQFVDPARLAVDVGANYGVYSFFLARLARQVVAYEPNPDLVAFLRRSVAGNVQVRPCALSDREGSAVLRIPVQNGKEIHGWGSLTAAAPGGAERAVTVSTRRLDDEAHIDVGFLKIDAEGHEMQVLEGGLATIRRDKPRMLIEIEARFHDGSVAQTLAFVANLGYRGFFFWQGRLQSVSGFRPTAEPAGSGVPHAGTVNNFIFVHRDDGLKVDV
jgi:FkbM family methyltransferase